MALTPATVSPHPQAYRTAFSLVELVMVVVIIGIIAAIAVPRVSRSAESSRANALAATLNNVRDAIDRYYGEHGKYPGYNPTDGNASGDWFVKQLTMFTDANGDVSTKRESGYLFGPYLSKPFPENPINQVSTVTVKAKSTMSYTAGTGWISYLDIGSFDINSSDEELTDFAGAQFAKFVMRDMHPSEINN